MVRSHDKPMRRLARSSNAGVILLLILIGGAALRLAVINPVRNYQLDFRAYYATGRAMQLGINPYDASAVREHVKLPGEQPQLMYVYPPPTLPLVRAFALLPYPLAQVPWALMQFGLGIGALLLLLRALGCQFGSPISVLLAFVFLVGSPVEALFRWGQFDMIVLFFVAAAFWAAVRKQSIWAGVFVGLAAIAKITPGALVLAFILRKDWKATLASGMTVVALMGASYAALGQDVFTQWQANLKQQPDNLSSMISAHNMSLHGYTLRALVENPAADAAPSPWIDAGRAPAEKIRWTLVGLVWIATIAWLLYRRRELDTAESLASVVPAILLTSPITWTHHGVLMLVPLAATLPVLLRQRSARYVDLAWYSLAALLLTIWPVQQFELQLPSWLTLLATPTLTYAIALLWLFTLLRFARLKQASGTTHQTIFSKPPTTAHLGGPIFSNASA